MAKDAAMSRKLMVLCILFVCVDNAQAIECQTSVQSGDHWAWRLIDGRKCWYKGASGMDKSLLHWPAADDSPDRLAVRQDIAKENIPAIPQVQSIPPEVLK